MAQRPAVVLIARHGQRLDMSDQSWHLSTPTPYDPPITYGGWNQSRSLGVRIASLLDERERSFNSARGRVGSDDFNGNGDSEHRPAKRRRLKHKVVVHTSPFLRCLQTSIGIAAGIAQHKPIVDDSYKRAVSLSPRVRATEGHVTAKGLSSIGEPKHDFAHAIALKALHEHQHYRKSNLRVDAFLGEWLNPEYFEGITAPPPSAMMVATAKAELMENETVEIFQPAVTKKTAGNNNLWAGANGTAGLSRESTLDDWSPVEEAMPPSPSRSRASTQTDVRGMESGRKSPFRPGSPLQPLTSNLPKPETSTYHPPTPHYAVSATQQIPRGYVAHARNACTDVDLQWDSSRQPEPWGDGGEYGEEWSALHKRIRRGLNRLIHWYSQEDCDEAADRTIQYEEEDIQEDLVVVLVTHGAGANALIGALTGQPILIDIGMASLTMAERKRDAPVITTPRSAVDHFGRRTSFDMGLSSLYDVKFIASSEHLRPGADSRGGVSPSGRTEANARSDSRTRAENPRKGTNASLGSIRRPSAVNANLNALQNTQRTSSHLQDGAAPPAPAVSTGLWTPPASRSPAFQATTSFLPPTDNARGRAKTSGEPAALDFGRLPPTSVPSSSRTSNAAIDEMDEDKAAEYDSDATAELPKPGDSVPPSLVKRLSREHLWGNNPTGAQVDRKVKEPKRRWTVDQD